MRSDTAPAVLEAILLGAMAGAAACKLPTEGYAPVPCASDGSTPSVLGGLILQESADYVELRDTTYEDEPIRVLDSVGTPCASATDVAACEALLALPFSGGQYLGVCLGRCTQVLFVVNRGDNVYLLENADEVLAELGAIDSADEAALVALVNDYDVACDDPEWGGVRAAPGGYEVLGSGYESVCYPVIFRKYQLGVDPDAEVTELDSELVDRSPACIGRRPAGLRAATATGDSPLGAWLAGLARLEAASVIAFAELDAELAAHGAPARLRALCQTACRDERRHARVMGRIARRHGGRVLAPTARPGPPREIEAMAVHNAVEGCVRETYGALVGRWQASHAADPAIRVAMQRIGQDETRHAALSWALAEWLDDQLNPAARARVAAARADALDALAEEEQAPVPDALERIAGYPPLAARRALLAGMAREMG